MSEIQEALSFVEKVNDIDAAILDVDLHGQKSYPVAQALAARQICFVFATGYGEEAIDQACRSYPPRVRPVAASRQFAHHIGTRPPAWHHIYGSETQA
ncbi:response regulator [Paraburkholderia acidiphila]|uniref:Response regulator receiver domain-containing protein n=1 Tax=Paraburkholderia acidiphila TaxID=2571747 RepID=A0A7Z2JCS5_9BURK|nr:hypothetical protein [Paraburkholderia acidiphila]QGZ59946.1 hypothetical protein FAZ97_33995 [Paraburkholderia acidiphila]